MKLQRFAIIEFSGSRYAELLYADADPADQGASFVSIRARLDKDGYPRLPELQLEALRRARSVIGDEIQRLQGLEASSS